MNFFGCTHAQQMIADRHLLEVIADEYGKVNESKHIIILERDKRYRIVEDTFINRHFHSVIDIHDLEIQPEKLQKMDDLKLISLRNALNRVGTRAQVDQVENENNRRNKELHDKLEKVFSGSVEKRDLPPTKPKRTKETPLPLRNIKLGDLNSAMKEKVKHYIGAFHPGKEYKLSEWGVFVILSEKQEKFYLFDTIFKARQVSHH